MSSCRPAGDVNDAEEEEEGVEVDAKEEDRTEKRAASSTAVETAKMARSKRMVETRPSFGPGDDKAALEKLIDLLDMLRLQLCVFFKAGIMKSKDQHTLLITSY